MKSVRCAIYTRKSSEEGLDQSFNSLDAQREACLAYIQSQKHEGWIIVNETYDDGGCSGGSMNRPGLIRLLTDIEARKIDIIVVYKVDRLTRALSDFAKMVEIFDRQRVSFVSVTQQFNTTNSMGRLTLNVLLSFAQFEREVTSERIRDKIAASKKKGIWMGGRVPLGYDAKDRKLIVNEKEAELVRHIYRRYVMLKSVCALKAELNHAGIQGKARKGANVDGQPFSKGAIYSVLSNLIYLGKIRHKNQIHQGNHEAIVSRDLWDAARKTVAESSHARELKKVRPEASLLAGKVTTNRGTRLIPVHSKRHGRRYRYYAEKKNKSNNCDHKRWRLAAHKLEELVLSEVVVLLKNRRLFNESLGIKGTKQAIKLHQKASQIAKQLIQDKVKMPALLRPLIAGVVVGETTLQIELSRRALATALSQPDGPEGNIRIEKVKILKKTGSMFKLILPPDYLGNEKSKLNNTTLRDIARGYYWYTQLAERKVKTLEEIEERTGLKKSYIRAIIQKALLPPKTISRLVKESLQPELYNY